nr:guanylate kinase [uncultured Spongiibacter sp.]
MVLAAPSGAGKTTLVHKLLEREARIKFSISYTTRPKREKEVHGEDYFFVSEGKFRAMRDHDAFLESAEVFDHWYGTSEAYVQSLIDDGRSVLLEIDWQGAQQVRKLIPATTAIFILPPSKEALQQRLTGRGQDDDAVIQRRMAAAVEEMSHYVEGDYMIINDDFDVALEELRAILVSHRLQMPKQEKRHRELLASLLT